MAPARLIALDFSTLDRTSPGSGLYRYAVGLISALGGLNSDDRFLVIGSLRRPVPELCSIFEARHRRFSYVQFLHATGRGAYWIDQFRSARLLRGNRASLVHNLHGHALLFAPCPTVITQHDLMVEIFSDYRAIRRSRLYRINRWAVRHRASRVISISATTAADLRKFWRIPPERIDVVHHGNLLACTPPRIDSGAQRTAKAEQRDRFIILSPYNLEPRKNLAALLQAVAALRSRGHVITLRLFGRAALTDEREREFHRLVRELGLDGRVNLTGFVNDRELEQLYCDSDVFVFPSLYEGFGLPVLEAMAAGKSVIARNASAMAEVAGEAAMLVETQNPAEIADAIATLIENPQLRISLAELSVERAKQFSTKRMAELTYASYQRVLDAA